MKHAKNLHDYNIYSFASNLEVFHLVSIQVSLRSHISIILPDVLKTNYYLIVTTSTLSAEKTKYYSCHPYNEYKSLKY